MSAAARMNGRVMQLATGRHLPRRTVRVRLTLLYGALFLVSGAALMAIAYLLLVNAGFVFTLQDGPPAASASPGPLGGVPALGSKTNPSATTMAHWSAVAQCMRRNGVSAFPNPTGAIPSKLGGIGDIADRDGAILVLPATLDQSSPTFVRASNTCGFMPDRTGFAAADSRRRTNVRQGLLIQSGIALAGMSLLSLGLGWLMAGRVLQPLEESYQAQRQFVANASHELRAPLARQRALIEVALADSQASAASLRATHERVLAAEQHLEQMIDGLLALTRGQAGLERREQLDVAELTFEVVHARERDLTEFGLDVRATLGAAPAVGDPRLLERLIANLIDNAIRHNIGGGHVEISTGTRDRRAFVSVANTGPTVPPEQIERLFQPFQRLAGARTGHNSGHGLGLSIVQAIATAHGAELAAHARPEGGLTIEVSLPAVFVHRRRSTSSGASPDAASARA